MTGVEHEMERRLQASLNRIREGDDLVTLTDAQATAQAMRLRSQGLPYIWIAKVMGTYHGAWYSEAWWRGRCRAAGAPAKHYPNGTLRVPPQLRRAA